MKISIIVLLLVITNSWAEKSYEVGCNTFRDVVNSLAFVDKSLLIKTFFEHNFVLITAPRRFGKSMNMDMLKQFVEVQVDKNGNKIRKNKTENYRVFTDKYHKVDVMDHLDVYKDRNFFHLHFGEYPVIYLDFKSLHSNSFSHFTSSFTKILQKEFNRHCYLSNSDKLSAMQKRELTSYYGKIESNIKCRSKYYSQKLTEIYLIDGLNFLSGCLYTHFNRSVIVLIDEYDAPIQDAIFNSGKDIGQILNFIKEFISNLLKSNVYVERSLINACLGLYVVATTDAEGIGHLPFGQKHPFAKFYGFTVEEVRALTKKFNIPEQMANIEAWYDGYVVAGDNIRLLNTWSIVSYFQDRSVKSYWVETGYVPELDKIVLSKCLVGKIDLIVNKGHVTLIYPNKISAESVEILRDVVDNARVDNKDSDLFLSFLLDLGYLTTLRINGDNVDVKAPNEEVRRELQNSLHSVAFFKQKLGITEVEINHYLDCSSNLQPVVESYKEFAYSILKLFKRYGMPNNEFELKAPLYTFLIFDKYRRFKVVRSALPVKTHKTTKKGYPIYSNIDLLFVTEDYTGVILKFKYDNYENQQTDNPLAQIIDRNHTNVYSQISLHENVKNKMYLGVHVKTPSKNKPVSICTVFALFNSLEFNQRVTVEVNYSME